MNSTLLIHSLCDFYRQMRKDFLKLIGASMMFNALPSTALMSHIGRDKDGLITFSI